MPFLPRNRLLLSLIVSLEVLLLAGCGGAGVRYAPPAVEHYEQTPLLRPTTALTFTLDLKNGGLAGEALAIEGMTRVPAGGDLLVVLDYQGATATVGTLHSSYVCIANSCQDAAGRSVDLTDARNFQPRGFNEPIIQGPLHLIVSYWIEGSILHRGTLQVVSGDHRALSNVDLNYTAPVALGKVLPQDQFFREMTTIASAHGAAGQDATLPGAADAAANMARSYFDGAFTDYQFVDRPGFMARSMVLKVMDTLAQTPDTLGKQAALRAWDQGAPARSANFGGLLAKAQDHLTEQYASGPRQLSLAVAQVEGNSAVDSVSQIVRELVGMPMARRQELGAEALRLLDAGFANTKPEEARCRAAILYDRAVVHYLLADFHSATGELQAARTENAKERDGIFGTSARELSTRIEVLAQSTDDRARRLAARR